MEEKEKVYLGLGNFLGKRREQIKPFARILMDYFPGTPFPVVLKNALELKYSVREVIIIYAAYLKTARDPYIEVERFADEPGNFGIDYMLGIIAGISREIKGLLGGEIDDELEFDPFDVPNGE